VIGRLICRLMTEHAHVDSYALSAEAKNIAEDTGESKQEIGITSKSMQKVATVTGAARGIGLGTVKRFLVDGWRVAIDEETRIRELCANGSIQSERSARSSGEALGALDVVVTSAEGALPLASARRAAIASSSLRRCPRAVTPSSLRSSAVRPGRTVSSISFSRNAASYFPRPKLRSQTTTSMMAPHNQWWRASSAGEARVSRVALGFSGLRKARRGLMAMAGL